MLKVMDSDNEEPHLLWRMAPSVAGAFVVAVVIWSVQTLQEMEINQARQESELREVRARKIPPVWVEQKVEAMELELMRIQRQIDRLESALGTKGMTLPPYSSFNMNGEGADT